MKIKHKLVVSFLLVALFASVTTLVTLQSYSEINSTFAKLIDDPTQMVDALNSLKHSGMQIVSSTSELNFIHSEALRFGKIDPEEEVEVHQMIDEGNGAFRRSLQEYEELVRTTATDEVGTLEDIRAAGNELIKTSDEIIALNKQGVRGRERLDRREKFEADEMLFLKIVDQALAKESEEQAEGQANVAASINLATQRTTVATTLTFLLALFLGIYLSFLFARRIARLRDASCLVGSGDFDVELDLNSPDEVGDLSRAFSGMMNDLKGSHLQIEAQRERLNTMIANVQGVVWETKASREEGEEALHFDFVSDYIETMLGYTVQECLAEPGFWLDVIHPDDRARTEEMVKSILISGKGGTIEFRWIAKDGREVWVETRNTVVKDNTGRSVGLRGIAVDVTERKSLERQLTHQALHDPLTKLGNRILFRDRVEHALKRTARKYSPIAVLFLDLDNFKSVNDSLGHAAGDELLVAVTERLQACLRPSDTPARFGGDEFAILLEDLQHPEQAAVIAERIRVVIAAPFLVAGTEVYISSSIGIALTIDGQESPEELLRNADVAMYTSKTQGRNRYTIFEHKMHDVLIKRVRLESDMRSAIENREFEVYYQPIMDLSEEKVIGMEALVRWNHPEQGLIPPMDFIPLAEETGLIVPLGRWILEDACKQARRWQTEFEYGENLSITVNVASRQFEDPTLFEVVEHALAVSGLPPHSLILEITENTMLANTESTIRKLTDLKKLKIRFAIDDFGTGYSSLSYLQRFPVDILKIDKSFIDKIAMDKEGAAVANAIISMSETLNLKTIAEGIESIGQKAVLQNLGCELGQGFHFAKPLRAKEMGEFLRRSHGKIDALPFIPILVNAGETRRPVIV